MSVSTDSRTELDGENVSLTEQLKASERFRGEARAFELCGAAFGFVLRYDGKIISLAAHHNLDAQGLEVLKEIWPMPPTRESLVGRAVLEQKVVHVHDILAEPNYAYSRLRETLGY